MSLLGTGKPSSIGRPGVASLAAIRLPVLRIRRDAGRRHSRWGACVARTSSSGYDRPPHFLWRVRCPKLEPSTPLCRYMPN